MNETKYKANEYGIKCCDCEEVIKENDYFFVNMAEEIDAAIDGDIVVVCD